MHLDTVLQNSQFNKDTLDNFHTVLEKTNFRNMPGVYLAGGALRRLISGQENKSDYDFFFRDVDARRQFTRHLEGVKDTHKKFHNPMNESWEMGPFKLQLITIGYYRNLPTLLDTFDFTICQFGVDNKMNFHSGEFSFWHEGRKRLALHKMTYPISTMRRLMKYTKQGYYACQGCLGQILDAYHTGSLAGRFPEMSMIGYVD